MRRIVVWISCSLCAACVRHHEPSAAGAAADPNVLARFGDQVLTKKDLDARLAQLDPGTRARYSAPEQRKRFLDSLVRFEMLAQEARDRGYDRDPDVQRVMKNQMIATYFKREVDDKIKPEDITEADVQHYYAERAAMFRIPEAVRVSQIVVKDRATAEKVAAKARAGKTPEAFRALVAQYSIDEDSKRRGGDLSFFERTVATYPRPVVDAAFRMSTVGEISPVVESPKGFHVLMLTDRHAQTTRPLSAVEAQIRGMLVSDRRAKKREELSASIRTKMNLQVYPDHLTAAGGG